MKAGTEDQILEACLERLRGLPPITKAQLRIRELRREGGWDAELALETELGQRTYLVEVKRSLSRTGMEHLLLRANQLLSAAREQLILFTDYVSSQLADRLAEAGVNFVEQAGNVFLHWPGQLYVHIQGTKPLQPKERWTGRLFQPSGLKVLFVLLAHKDAVAWPYRELAAASGVALGSIAWIMQELKEKGYLEAASQDQWRLVRKKELMDNWVGGYADRLRPKLVLNRFQPPERDLDRVLAALKAQLSQRNLKWALTGGFAADTMVHHYRGEHLSLFVEQMPPDLPRGLKWLPSPHGPVTVMRMFSPHLIFKSEKPLPRPVAHPLLVYAELVFQGRDRELETAKLIYERYLASLLNAH